MRIIFWILILFFLAIFQTSFLAKVLGSFLTIDLVFLTVLSLAILKNGKEAVFFGAVSGFFLDLYSTRFFGLSALSLALTCLIAFWFLRTILTKSNFLVLMTVGFSMTIIFYGLFSFFSWLARFVGGNFWFIFSKGSFVFFLTQLLINTFLFVGIFHLVKLLNGILKPR